MSRGQAEGKSSIIIEVTRRLNREHDRVWNVKQTSSAVCSQTVKLEISAQDLTSSQRINYSPPTQNQSEMLSRNSDTSLHGLHGGPAQQAQTRRPESFEHNGAGSSAS